MSEFVTVAKVGDLEEGQGAAFPFEGKLVAVFLKDGEYLAIDDLCPHAGASLAEGYLEDFEVSCPWHAWRFDIRDGTWCDNRRLKVQAYETRVVDDEIQVRPVPPAEDTKSI